MERKLAARPSRQRKPRPGQVVAAGVEPQRGRTTLSGFMEEGDLDHDDLLQLLAIIEMGSKTGVLVLTPENRTLKTRIAFAEGMIVGVSSALLPSWGTSLLRTGLSRDLLQEIQQKHRGTHGILNALVTGGALPVATLARILRQRALMALLAVQALLPVRFSFVVAVTIPSYPGTGTRPTELGMDLARQLEAMQRAGAEALHGAEVYRAAETDSGDPEQLTGAERLLLETLKVPQPLWNVARTSNMLWSQTAETIASLTRRGLLERVEGARSETEGRRLEVGANAPRFTLTSSSHEAVGLGSLRGAPVLLIFFRSRTCPLARARLRQLQASRAELEAAGLQVVIVTGDEVPAQARRMSGPLLLLSDPDGKVRRRYGVELARRGYRNLFTQLALFRSRSQRPAGSKEKGGRREAAGLPAGDGRWSMTAEFWINADLRLEQAHYPRQAHRLPPLKKALAWARDTDRPTEAAASRQGTPSPASS